MSLSFDEVFAIEDLVNYPWVRTPEVQKEYDKVKKHVTLLFSKELRVNEYPYDLDETCQHLVLWSKKPLTPEMATKYLDKKLKTPYVAWMNAKANQSVPDVYHVHVICKK